MKHAIRLTLMAGIAAGALMMVSGDRGYAQGADPNAAPNPYKTQDNWAQLTDGRKFGAAIKVVARAPRGGRVRRHRLARRRRHRETQGLRRARAGRTPADPAAAETLTRELQEWVKSRLAVHKYPR